MKLAIGDRVVAKTDAPGKPPKPPVGRIGVVVGFAVRFPGYDNTWIFDRDELEPAAIDALGDLANGGRSDAFNDVGGGINAVYGVEP